jgi:hypothetical protein
VVGPLLHLDAPYGGLGIEEGSFALCARQAPRDRLLGIADEVTGCPENCQTNAVLLEDAVATRVPSALNAALHTLAVCLLKTAISFPLMVSHGRAVVSLDAVITRVPSGLKAAPVCGTRLRSKHFAHRGTSIDDAHSSSCHGFVLVRWEPHCGNRLSTARA